VAGFADASGRFLPLVCTLNATGVTDAMARLLDVGLERLDAMALGAAPGSGGLVLVPYFAGERTPNRPNATGTVSGLRPDVTREQLARAAFEGVVCSALDALDALQSVGIATGAGRMLLVGGGARSAAYRQVLADIAGREVEVPHGGELVATGACVQAAAMLHQQEPAQVATSWRPGTTSLVAPHEDVDHEGIRAAYAAARG
jgi:xylulokinase